MTLARADFLREVESFHERFMAQMRARVDEVCSGWRRPDVRINFDDLRREQAERPQAWAQALARKPPANDWSEVQRALDVISSKF
jgi:hypothetical protein